MAKEKRSLFQKIFGTEQSKVFGTQMQMLSGYTASFTSWNGSTYSDTTARSCIDAIARNAAKLTPKHIRQTGSKYEVMNSNLRRLLAEQPNTLMNAYDFYYKIVSQLYLNNNAIVYVERDGATGEPTALYPLNTSSCTMVEYAGKYFVKFGFNNGKQYTAPIEDVVHLKRFFCENDVTGGSTTPITATLSTLDTVKQGIENAIKTTAGIKAILKTSKAMLKPEDIKAVRDAFISDFIDDASMSGIGGLDATTDFIPINVNPQTATDKQMSDLYDEVLRYYGVSEAILKSDYTPDQWNAFYESTLEPIAIMLSLEFTNKLFSNGQKGFGNRIIFEAQRLQYASMDTKVEIAKNLNNFMTINEIRDIFNMAPVDDGDRMMQDLNHIDSNIANSYQGGEPTNE